MQYTSKLTCRACFEPAYDPSPGAPTTNITCKENVNLIPENLK